MHTLVLIICVPGRTGGGEEGGEEEEATGAAGSNAATDCVCVVVT